MSAEDLIKANIPLLMARPGQLENAHHVLYHTGLPPQPDLPYCNPETCIQQPPVWYARYWQMGDKIDIQYLLLGQRWLSTCVQLVNGRPREPSRPLYLTQCGTQLVSQPGTYAGLPPYCTPRDAVSTPLGVVLLWGNNRTIDPDPGWSPGTDPYLRANSIEGDPRMLDAFWGRYGIIPPVCHADQPHEPGDLQLLYYICIIIAIIIAGSGLIYYARRREVYRIDREAAAIMLART